MPNLSVNQYYKKMKWLVFLLVFLPSCEKGFCWDCVLTKGTMILTHPWVTTTTQKEYCDKTENEINQIISDNEKRGMSFYSYMTCTKRQ
jgi:hypothetical protein